MPTLKHGDTTIGYGRLYVKVGVSAGTNVDSVLFGPDDANTTEVYPPYRIYTYRVDPALSGKVTVTCTRTSSPNAGAATGALNSGEPIYTGDTLSYTLSAISGYYIFTTSTGSIAGNKSGSETVNGDVTLTCDTIAYYWLTFSIETGSITASCTRTYSRVSSASIGSISPGSTTTQIFAGDTLSFSASSSSGYYVLEASTRDSTSYSETINSVSGNVTRQFHAVTKNSFTFNVRASSTAIGGTYPYSYTKSGLTNVFAASSSSTSPYKPYPGSIIGAQLGTTPTTSSTSTSVHVSGKCAGANDQVRGTIYYYTYAPVPITITKPRLTVDNYGNRMRVRIFNDNSFAVNAEYGYYYDDSSGESGDGANSISNIGANSYYELNIYTSSGASVDYFEFSAQFSKDGSTSDWEYYYD